MTSRSLDSFPDYYKILNIPYGSSEEVIRGTFRSLAKLFHPDNPKTGNRNRFEEVHIAYRLLISDARIKYDLIYQKLFAKVNTKSIQLKESRISYMNSMTELAKRGLLRTGLRTRDRKKYTGNFHDIDLKILEEEKNFQIQVRLPLTARILCPSCKGSDIYCESCNGIGKYKATRYIQFVLNPNMIIDGRIFELELSRLRPDKFTHFKKKKLRVRITIER